MLGKNQNLLFIFHKISILSSTQLFLGIFKLATFSQASNSKYINRKGQRLRTKKKQTAERISRHEMAKTKIDCSKKFSVLNSFLHENCSTWSLTSLNISCLIKYKFEINLDGVCPFSFHFSSFLHVYSSCPSLPATSSLTTFEEKKTKTEGKQNKREKTKLTLWSLFNKQSVSYFASFSNHVNVG